MPGRALSLSCALAILAAAPGVAQAPADRETARLEQLHRLEGEAVVALADAAMAGQPVPADLALDWRNDYLKARQGTFVPFVVSFDARLLSTPAVLLYVRMMPCAARAAQDAPAAADARGDARRARGTSGPAPVGAAVEEIYPIDTRGAGRARVRVMRGLAAHAGDYDLVVVARERVDPARPRASRRAGVLRRRLSLPDFGRAGLSASSVIIADRLTVLDGPPPTSELSERPYLIGLSDIQPAADTVLRRDEELIVVFLVYNPSVNSEKNFDVEVEYHFFTNTGGAHDGEGTPPPGAGRPAARTGERYFNHTKPQRFTPAVMGPTFDPAAGHPLLAGQGVPLASFPPGHYRLAIRVTDIVTGQSIQRDVAFTVVG